MSILKGVILELESSKRAEIFAHELPPEDRQLKRIIAIVEVLDVVLPLLVNVIIVLLQVIKAVVGDVATLVKAVLSPVLETVGEVLIRRVLD